MNGFAEIVGVLDNISAQTEIFAIEGESSRILALSIYPTTDPAQSEHINEIV